MHADINFRKGNNDVINEVTVEDEASETSPDKHQDNPNLKYEMSI